MSATNIRAALFMVLAMAGYVFNDVFMKSLAEDMSMGQAIFLRGVLASIFIYLIARQSGALRPVRLALKPMPLLRTLSEVLATVFFLTALAHVQLATASAILQALPLAVTLGASLFLKETVGWRRWLAILLGFCGVIIVIQPGFTGYSPFALLIFCAVICAAARDLATRVMDEDVPSLFLSAMTAPAVALAGLGLWVFDGNIAPMSGIHIVKLLAAAVFILIGYQFIVLAMREGEIAFVAPFRYTSLLWSILLGMIFFSDFPDSLTITGSAIVVVTGLYTLYRERRAALRN
jgi:drug/metabolite transporter (DMT)-like permease